MINSSTSNTYLTFTHIGPAFGGKRPDKHSRFLKELAISLIALLASVCAELTLEEEEAEIMQQIVSKNSDGDDMDDQEDAENDETPKKQHLPALK